MLQHKFDIIISVSRNILRGRSGGLFEGKSFGIFYEDFAGLCASSTLSIFYLTKEINCNDISYVKGIYLPENL